MALSYYKLQQGIINIVDMSKKIDYNKPIVEINKELTELSEAIDRLVAQSVAEANKGG